STWGGPWWRARPRAARRPAPLSRCRRRARGARAPGWEGRSRSYEPRPRPHGDGVDDQHDGEDHDDDQPDAGVVEEVQALLEGEPDAAGPHEADDHGGPHVDLEDVEHEADHRGGHLRDHGVDDGRQATG